MSLPHPGDSDDETLTADTRYGAGLQTLATSLREAALHLSAVRLMRTEAQPPDAGRHHSLVRIMGSLPSGRGHHHVAGRRSCPLRIAMPLLTARTVLSKHMCADCPVGHLMLCRPALPFAGRCAAASRPEPRAAGGEAQAAPGHVAAAARPQLGHDQPGVAASGPQLIERHVGPAAFCMIRFRVDLCNASIVLSFLVCIHRKKYAMCRRTHAVACRLLPTLLSKNRMRPAITSSEVQTVNLRAAMKSDRDYGSTPVRTIAVPPWSDTKYREWCQLACRAEWPIHS